MFLNKKIISFEDKLFGLDLSDLSVKAFQLVRDSKIDKIRGFASQEIPAGNIEDGRIINQDQVAEYIRRAITTARPKKINTKKVICSVPESKAFLRTITIPKMSEEEAGEAIKWEIEASIPLAVDQVYYDWQFIEDGASKNKQQLLTVAVSKEVVDELTAVLEKAGLEIYGLELESIASVRSLISQKAKPTDVVLITDIGAQRTSFIITEGNIPFFTSSIPFSSEGMNDSIAKTLNIDLKEAERIKIIHGIGEFDEDPTVYEAVKSLLENLIVEIEKTIDFYLNMSKESAEIKKIILCGGGSNLKGIIPYLTKRLKKDVIMSDPWINLNLGQKLPPINKADSVRFSTVIGLALRAINYGNKD